MSGRIENPNAPAILRIQEVVAKRWGMPVEWMNSPRRDRKVCFIRNLAIWASVEMLGAPQAEVGRMFRRDMTTIRNSLRRINRFRGRAMVLDELTEGKLQEIIEAAKEQKRDGQ